MPATRKKTLAQKALIACLAVLIGPVFFSQSRSAEAQALTPLEEDVNEGRVTIQGVVQDDLAPVDDSSLGPLVDYQEEMRLFIQNIGQYARTLNPNFFIVVENALELLTKTSLDDEDVVMPARAYTRSIDGVLEVGLFHGTPFFGKPHDEPKKQDALLKSADRARKEALPVLVLDRANERDVIEAGRALSKQRRYVYASIPSQNIENAVLPDFPARPFDEGPGSVLSLGSVKNYAVIGNSAAYGREDEFVMRMHATNYDMLIVDVFHGRKPLSKQAVETLKYKKTGSKRLVLARINIGTAASYHYYWKPSWAPGSPLWIGSPMSRDPDRYFVEFWRPEWQRIISGDTQSFIYGIISQGYDGVVLSDADVYGVLETGGEN